MIKQYIIKRVSPFNYPQRELANAILEWLDKAGVQPSSLVDCPCGNGETSFRLASLNNCKVTGADISEESIKTAKATFVKENLEFVCADLKQMTGFEKKADVFCLINSLFLLNEAENILRLFQQRIQREGSKLIIIIPNTGGRNFKWFQQHYPNENKLIINEKDIVPFFTRHAFKVETVKPIAYTHHLYRNDVKLFSVFRPFYLRTLNFFQKLFKIGKPNYFLIALTA